MSAEENKAVMRRIFELFNTGNLALVDEVIAADVIDHQAPPGIAPGRAGFKQLIAAFRAAFPDLQMTIDDILADGDKVVTRSTMRGTHQGEFMGIPPTGKPFTMGAIDIVRFSG